MEFGDFREARKMMSISGVNKSGGMKRSEASTVLTTPRAGGGNEDELDSTHIHIHTHTNTHTHTHIHTYTHMHQ